MADEITATKAELAELKAGIDARFGALATELADLRERIAAAKSGGDHVHVPPGHGASSVDVVTGPPQDAA